MRALFAFPFFVAARGLVALANGIFVVGKKIYGRHKD